jgi:indole-3-glycerol phosphate synthase
MLGEILTATRRRVAALAASSPATTPPSRPDEARGLTAALAAPGLKVIAEIKRRSPSAGAIAPDLDPVTQARAYLEGGAAAISVLTEPDFFGGSLDDLRAVRAAVPLPVLRKDFILDPLQVAEAAAAGADALLLIVAALDADRLGELLAACEEVGVEALVEVHDAAELVVANQAGAPLIGVNNRDLRTFVTDLTTAEALAGDIRPGAVTVAESGVVSPAGAARMAAAGYDAVLVGEAAVRSGDPAGFVTSLREAAS